MSIITVQYLQNFRGTMASEDRGLLQDAGAGSGIVELGDLQLFYFRKKSKYVWMFKLEEGEIIIPETGGNGAYLCRFDERTIIDAPRIPRDDRRERLDIIIARVYDSGYGGGRDEAVIEYITGTEVKQENMTLRSGAPATPQNSLVLYDISQRGDPHDDINIKDRRRVARPGPRANVGGTKWDVLTGHRGSASFKPVGLKVNNGAGVLGTQRQVAYAVYLRTGHRKHASMLPFLRWGYVQGSPVLTGTYRVGVYDSSGRRIAYTKQYSLRGNVGQKINELLDWEPGNNLPKELPPGIYWIGWNANFAGGGAIGLPNGVILPVVANKFNSGFPNVLLDKAYSSITPSSELSGYTDCVTGGVVAPTAVEGVPMFVLDVETGAPR